MSAGTHAALQVEILHTECAEFSCPYASLGGKPIESLPLPGGSGNDLLGLLCIVEKRRDRFRFPKYDAVVHVVFTLPRELAPLAPQNKRLIYNLLFHASAAPSRSSK